MAVQLFRAGTGTVFRGIECESRVFNEFSYLHLLDQGWFYTPEECYAEEEASEGSILSDGELRALAKREGITNWHNKSIARLKRELAADVE